MSEFSSQWLALREPADHRSRNQALREQLNQLFARSRTAESLPLRIIDLGSGTGSNLRGLSPHLDCDQHWTLIDYDPKLIEAARLALSAWADTAEPAKDTSLRLRKGDKHLQVDFLCTDLSKNIELILEQPADLLTAAAFFDLVAEPWLERFCSALCTPLYTVLTYDGSEQWTPTHPADEQALRAFHAHQATDKGFGLAAGPKAVDIMQRRLLEYGFQVSIAPSPWELDQTQDAALIHALATGSAQAVGETGLLDAATLASWKTARQEAQACMIGHWDLLATFGS
jgi:hypothetical protein